MLQKYFKFLPANLLTFALITFVGGYSEGNGGYNTANISYSTYRYNGIRYSDNIAPDYYDGVPPYLSKSTYSYAQQCALPAIISPIGGDRPTQADGIWYMYRQMGNPIATNPRAQITSIAPTVEPFDNFPAWLQWWEIASYPDVNSYKNYTCQQRFWTGTYSMAGKEVGYLGVSNDDHIMRPSNYVVLHHDYQKLMVTYSCERPRAYGICAIPKIYVWSRKRPDELSVYEADSFDAIVDSIFSKYCVTVKDIPKQNFQRTPFCPFIDPPYCIAQEIQGMKNSAAKPTSKGSAAENTSTTYYAKNVSITYYTPPDYCKWPNTMPSPRQFDVEPNGLYFLYRRIFGPEQVPVNQQVFYYRIGPSSSPLMLDKAHTYWLQYANYDPKSYACTYGVIVATVGQGGLVTALIAPDSSPLTPHPFTLTTLYLDDSTVLYYGCASQNLQTGICDAPVAVHLTRTNPALFTQTERSAQDALENFFFSKYGCSANDVSSIQYTTDQPACPFIPPKECMQKHITGYEQVVAANANYYY